LQRLSAAAQRERDRLSTLVNSITDEIWFADAEKQLTLVNPAVWREFGSGIGDVKEVEKIAAQFEVYRPDGTPRPVDEAPPLRAHQGETVTGQDENVRTPATGQLRHRQVNAAPVRDAAGAIIGSVSVVRDITERKRAEEALRESEARLHVTLNSIGDAVLSVDTAGCVTFLNPVAVALTGWPLPEAVGQPIQKVFRIVDETSHQPGEDIVQRVLRERRVVALANHTVLVARDGREMPSRTPPPRSSIRMARSPVWCSSSTM
jgi:PAS domain S-box-containing protein